jgi:tRNA pseudouridine38-40 synthase
MRNIALVLEYDGTNLVGSQFQTNGRTVQGELEAAWARFTGEQKRWTFAGRTDAGVHALGQVANLRTATSHTLATIQRAINALLPLDVAVRRVWEAPYDFHARYSATRRSYRYLLLTERWRAPLWRAHALHAAEPLDIEAIGQALKLFKGVHDFAAFGSTTQGSTVRECFKAECQMLERDGLKMLAIDLEASGFLQHMVRTIVGTMLLVGQHKQKVEDVTRILQSRDRAQAGPTAPAHGLYLMSVTYPAMDRRPASTLEACYLE